MNSEFLFSFGIVKIGPKLGSIHYILQAPFILIIPSLLPPFLMVIKRRSPFEMVMLQQDPINPFPLCQLPAFCLQKDFQFSSVQSLSHVRLFVTLRTAACQASLSITNSRSLLKLMPIESVIPSSLCCPLLLLPPILPASGSFPMSQLFT